MWPARAKASSTSPATPASSAEKTTLGPRPGTHASTVRLRTAEGIGAGNRHADASVYFLPSDRSLAASHVTLNHGWCSSRDTNCCPTIPVAPRTPTSIFVTNRSPLSRRSLGEGGQTKKPAVRGRISGPVLVCSVQTCIYTAALRGTRLSEARLI